MRRGMHRIPLLLLAALALALSRGRSRRRTQGPSLDDFKLPGTDLDLHALAGQLVRRDVGPLVDDANRSPWRAAGRTAFRGSPVDQAAGVSCAIGSRRRWTRCERTYSRSAHARLTWRCGSARIAAVRLGPRPKWTSRQRGPRCLLAHRAGATSESCVSRTRLAVP